jgi:hypothetical protein
MNHINIQGMNFTDKTYREAKVLVTRKSRAVRSYREPTWSKGNYMEVGGAGTGNFMAIKTVCEDEENKGR